MKNGEEDLVLKPRPAGMPPLPGKATPAMASPAAASNSAGESVPRIPASVLPASPLFQAISTSLKVAVAGFTVAIWAIVGFVFWIPLLARATTSFAVSATYSNLVARGAHVPNAGLEHATLFYVSGFRSIVASIFASSPPAEAERIEFKARRFLAEIAWTMFFWWGTLVSLSALGVMLTPYSETYLSLPWLWEQLTGLMSSAEGSV